jgi:hypothetical protein
VTQPAAFPPWVDALRWQLLPLLRQQTGIRWDTRAQLNVEAWLDAAQARGMLTEDPADARGAVRSILCKSAREQAAFDAVFEGWLAHWSEPPQRPAVLPRGAGGGVQPPISDNDIQQARRKRLIRQCLLGLTLVLLTCLVLFGYQHWREEQLAIKTRAELAAAQEAAAVAAAASAAAASAAASTTATDPRVMTLQVVPPTPAEAASAAAAAGLGRAGIAGATASGAAAASAAGFGAATATPTVLLFGIHPAIYAALVLAAACAGFTVRRTRQQFIQRITTRENLREQEVFARQLLPVSGTRREGLRRAVRLLRRAEPGPVRELDVLASVRASATRAGLFTAVHRQRAATPAYLVLVDRLRPGDQQAHWAIEAARDLAAEGVPLALYEFDRDPRWVAPLRLQRSIHAPTPQRYVPLSSLAASHAGQGLLILADGQGLLDHATGRLHTWLAPALAAWPRRVLMTPRPMAAWGAAEDVLAGELQATHESSFLLVPSQFDAWLAAAHWLRRGELVALTALPGAPAAWPPLLADDPHRWLSRSAPGTEELVALVEQLRAYLGPTAYTWLAASAAYPLLSADLTAYLAHHLPDPAMPVVLDSSGAGEASSAAGIGGTAGAASALTAVSAVGVVGSTGHAGGARAGGPMPMPMPVHVPAPVPAPDARLLEARLVAIAQLPWCRHGLMPDWLRRALLLSLPQSTRRHVRAVIAQLFATAGDAQQASAAWSLGKVATGLPRAEAGAASAWWRQVRALGQRIGMAGVLEQEPSNSPLRDVVYLGVLRGEFDGDLQLEAPEEFARAARAEEVPTLSWNPLRWLAAGGLSVWFGLRWLYWKSQLAAAQGRARGSAVMAVAGAAAPKPATTLVGEVAFSEVQGDRVQAEMETNSEPMLESMLESVAEGPELATPATRETPVHPSRTQVFISYQRGDRETAVRLYAQLERRLLGQVFMDAASGEPEELEWHAEIQRALQSAAVVLVLVGPRWKVDARRYAEAEVAAALQGGKVVVPVLINGASLPRASALPPSLRALVTRQALTLPEQGFEQAVELMANELVQWLRPPTGSKGASKRGERK